METGTIIKGKIWTIEVEIPENQKEATIDRQSFLEGKNVKLLLVSKENKDINNNDLQNDGFYVQIEYNGNNRDIIPSSLLNQDSYHLPSIIQGNDIQWQGSKIIFPDIDASSRFVNLIAIYE